MDRRKRAKSRSKVVVTTFGNVLPSGAIFKALVSNGLVDSIGLSITRQAVYSPMPGTVRYVNNTGDIYLDPTGATWGIGNDTTGNGTKSAPYATITKVLTQTVSGDTIVLTPSTFVSGIDFTATGFTLAGKTGVLFRGADPDNYSELNGAPMGAAAGGSAGSSMVSLADGSVCRYLHFTGVAAGPANDYNPSYYHWAVGAAGTTPTIDVSLCKFSKNYRDIKLNSQNGTTWILDQNEYDECLNQGLNGDTTNTNSFDVTSTRSVFSGVLYPSSKSAPTLARGIYAQTANAACIIRSYGNIFAGIAYPISSPNGYTGTIDAKNNIFIGASSHNINVGTGTTLIESNNAWLGGSVSPSSYFGFKTNGFTPSASDLSSLIHTVRSRYKGWYILRFDDRPSTVGTAKDDYYRQTADVLAAAGLKASYAFDTAGLTAQDISTGQYLLSKGHEISSHTFSHISLDNDVGSPRNIPFSITGPAGSNITIASSGTVPEDTVSITLTEGATSIQVSYPAMPALNYDMADTPRAYTTSATGVITGSVPGSYDLGSLKGLRDYIDSLTNWSATTLDTGEYDHADLTQARNLADINTSNPSNTALPWNTTRLHWWEMRYPKLVLENLLSTSVKTLIYPNYRFDALTKTNALTHGYLVGMGPANASDIDQLNAAQAIMFNVQTHLLYYYKDFTDLDLAFRLESFAEWLANTHSIFSLMCHVVGDFSVAQWGILAQTLSAYSDRAVCVTGAELGALISGNALWTTADNGLTYRRTDWTEYTADFRLPSTSPCIGAGTGTVLTGVAILYDKDGVKIYDDTTQLPDGPWLDGVDIGPFAYIFGDKYYLSLLGTDGAYYWPSAPELIARTGVDNVVYNANGAGKTFATQALALAALVSLEDGVRLVGGIGGKRDGAAMWGHDLTAAELIKANRYFD